MELTSVKTPNLQDLIQQQIKNYIIDSNLKTGDPLPTEKQLSEKLEISHTVVRESLKSLQAVGLVEAIHGRGYFVKDFNLQALLDNLPYMLEMHLNDYRDILEIRIVLESHYLTHQIQDYTREDIDRLKAILAELAQKYGSNANFKETIDIHSQFHCELYRRSDNMLLMNLIKIFSTIQKNLTYLKRFQRGDPAPFIEHHRQIIDAIEKRDGSLARDRLISHFGDAIEWVKNNSQRGILTI
jgi:GntR family transcriptional repressor for pyruvate dehydrogenase complex